MGLMSNIVYVYLYKCQVCERGRHCLKKFKISKLKLKHYFNCSFETTNALSNGKSQKYHLIANEAFFISLTSKLVTYFIDGCTLGKKSQSIAYY